MIYFYIIVKVHSLLLSDQFKFCLFIQLCSRSQNLFGMTASFWAAMFGQISKLHTHARYTTYSLPAGYVWELTTETLSELKHY